MSFQATTEALPWPVFCPSGLIRILMVQSEHWASTFPWLSPFFSCQAERHLIRRLWAQVLKWQSKKWEKAIPIGEIRRTLVCFVCRRMELHPTLVSQCNPSGLHMQMWLLDAYERLWMPGKNVPTKQTWYSAGEASGVHSDFFFFFMLTDKWCANGIINPLSHTGSHASVSGRPYELPWRRNKHLGHLVARQLSGQKMGMCVVEQTTKWPTQKKVRVSQWLWWGAKFQFLCYFLLYATVSIKLMFSGKILIVLLFHSGLWMFSPTKQT